uniref:Glycoside hydrolase family 5 domain-containing protein n=1 Tax=Globisporangium ultimum (strain ATCC 200006 / CBS 805.95 / DAOM BR144) TaxID=431595 RepID=K3W879_GLOUD
MYTRWLGVIAALVASADVSLAANTTSTTSSSFINFRSVNGKLLADGETFYIKGINWFGFETIEGAVQGLWPSATTIETALDTLVENDFNAVRLPLALDSVINDPDVSNDQTAGTAALAGKTYLEVLDYFVNEARKRNILVLLDSHRIEAAEPDFPDVAEPTKITPALEKLATRYCNNPATWNVFGIDIKNEPKGTATWGSGDEATDWRLAAATIGNAVLAKQADHCKGQKIIP